MSKTAQDADSASSSAEQTPAHDARSGTPTRRRPASAGRVDDELVATYTAARAFLVSEWIGALLMLASFTVLYWLTFGPWRPGPTPTLIGSVAVLALGTWMFWTSRTYYQRLDFPWRRRWEAVATVVAGSGAVFWLLFVLLVVLDTAGVALMPE